MTRRTTLGTLGALLLATAAVAPAATTSRWNPPVRLSGASDPSYGDDVVAPRVAVNARGDAVALWQLVGHHQAVVQVASRRGRRWSKAVTLSPQISTPVSPLGDIALGDGGAAVAVWQVRTPGHRFVVRAAARTAGGRWLAAATLSKASADWVSPSVAVDARGDATAVWMWQPTQDAPWHMQAATRPAGGVWSAPVELTTTADQLPDPPLVAYDAAGDATAVWSSNSSTTGLTVQTATRPAGGHWSAVTDVGTSRQFYPGTVRFAENARGDMAVVWEDVRPSDVHVIYGATRPAGGAWTVPQLLSRTTRTSHTPVVAIGADGVIAAAWQTWNGHDYAIAADTGRARTRFGASGILPPGHTAGRIDGALGVAVDARGTAYVAYSAAYRTGVSALTAIRPAGAARWRRAPLGSAGVDQPQVAIAAGPSGDATALWVRADDGQALVDESELSGR